MLYDPLFWLFIAFSTFILIAIIKFSRSFKNGLNNGIKEIEQELKHTKQLLHDSEKRVKEKRSELEEAEQQAINIQENVQEEIQILQEGFQQKLDDLSSRIEKQANEKIEKAQRDAFDMIKNTSVEIAMSSARKILEKKFQNDSKAKQYIDTSLENIKLN